MSIRYISACFAALLCAAQTIQATPAQDRLNAFRVKCELQTAGAQSLQTLTWQQGTTPLLSLDQYRDGRAVDADSNAVAIVRFGPRATGPYFVSVTNYATSANGYLVQMPTIGTNTTAVAGGTNWWYTAYYEKSGYRYWTGNGRLQIIATDSTGDGLHWQTVTCTTETDPVWKAQKTGYATTAALGATSAVDRAYALGLHNSQAAGVAAGLLALPRASLPGILATSTVARAGHAASAAFATNAATADTATTASMLANSGGEWVRITFNGTTGVIERVTATSNLYVVAVSGVGYNGPAAGTVFDSPVISDGVLRYEEGDFYFLAEYNGGFSASAQWALFGTDKRWDAIELMGTLPQDFYIYTYMVPNDSIGSLTVGYVPVTNSTALATQADIDAALAAYPTAAVVTNIATELISTHNASGTAHADIRALIGGGSASTIYTPVYAATTTIAVNSTQAVYKATFGTAGTVTQSIAGLTVNAGQEARWELWLNATNLAALSPTWQSNLDWQGGTPDMTVTGLYKFAMSTTGGRITGRQTYPTVHRWMSAPASAARNSNTAATLAMFQELIATADTSAYAYVPLVHDMQSPTLLRFSSYVYAVNASTNPITLKIGMGFPQLLAPTKEATLSTSIQLAVYAGERGVPKTFYVPALEKTNLAYVWPYVVFSKPYVGGRAVITLWQTKLANELEQAAYAAGWRP